MLFVYKKGNLIQSHSLEKSYTIVFTFLPQRCDASNNLWQDTQQVANFARKFMPMAFTLEAPNTLT